MNLYKTIILTLLTLSFNSAATAQNCNDNQGQAEQQEISYRHCDNQTGWYIGGDFGIAKTNISQSDVDNFYSNTDINASSLNIDKDDQSYSLSAGYQFRNYFAVEGGYLDLGERMVEFTGSDADIETYYANAEHIYPQSAEGIYLAAVGSWVITEKMKLSGKLGVFSWQADYLTFEGQDTVGNDSTKGNDLLIGAEFNYRLSDKVQAYISASRFELDRDSNDRFTLGLRYYFNDSQQPTPSKPTEQNVVAAVAAAPLVLVDTDADDDGVINSSDQCPHSDIKFKVDEKGCTLMAEQWSELTIIIYFANDSAIIPEQAQSKVQEVADFVNQHNIENLVIEGHTSSQGSESYNEKLSLKRAQAVAQALMDEHSINPEVIDVIGKGETQLLQQDDTEKAHKINRRIVVKLKKSVAVAVQK